MPRYEYVLEHFKRYDGWKTQQVGSQESVFEPRWNTPHWLNGISFVLVVAALLGCTWFAIRSLPSDNTIQLSFNEYQSLFRQFQAGEYSFTVSACPKGLIGELEDGHIYWVQLGYDGRKWTRNDGVPASSLDTCVPPLIPQYQRLALVAFASIVLIGAYGGVNYSIAKRRWGQILPITLIQHGDTTSIRQGDTEYIPSSYRELDEKYDLPTDFFPMTRVVKVILFLILLGSACAWFAAIA